MILILKWSAKSTAVIHPTCTLFFSSLLTVCYTGKFLAVCSISWSVRHDPFIFMINILCWELPRNGKTYLRTPSPWRCRHLNLIIVINFVARFDTQLKVALQHEFNFLLPLALLIERSVRSFCTAYSEPPTHWVNSSWVCAEGVKRHPSGFLFTSASWIKWKRFRLVY